MIHVSCYETFQMGVQPRQNEATSFCCLLRRHQQWLHHDVQIYIWQNNIMAIKNAQNVILIIAYYCICCPTSFRATTNSPILTPDLPSKNFLYHNQLLHVGVCNGKCFINQPHLAVQQISAKLLHRKSGKHVSAEELKTTVNTWHNLPGNL